MAVKVKMNLREIEQTIKLIPSSIKTRSIAEFVREKMLSLISKGISPIDGNGRFPGYKGHTQVRSLEKQRNEARKRGDREGAFKAAAAAIDIKEHLNSYFGSYPYNTEEYKKGKKKPRPVNLTLTGKFLRRLIAKPKGKFVIEIGFFDSYGRDLERGHREGANGQLERPIIPVEGEQFVNSIRLGMIKMLRKSVEEFLNGRR